MGPYAHAAWALYRGFVKYETLGRLHRFRRNRRNNRLRRWPDRRSLVPGNEPAGIPQRLLLRVVGRVAARREDSLRSGSTTHALVKGTAGVARGFPPFETDASVWKEDVMTDPRFTDPR